MDSLLRAFNGDVHTKEALKQYLSNFIAKQALEKMYKKEDVSHISDAHNLLDDAFEQLDIDYGINEQPRQQTNPAR